jgi:hypothetical protein
MERKQVLKDINSEENYSRKRDAQRRFDVYRNRQDRYILERLQNEFSVRTVQEMRTVLSINLSERIIDELSSIYKNDPVREFADASDAELEQIHNLYDEACINSMMKMSNRYYNLFDDLDILVLPMDGKVKVKPLTKMGYDIIPQYDNPEKPFALVMSAFDLSKHATYRNEQNITDDRQDYYNQDFVNQKTADDDDRQAKLQRYIWWTDEVHFTTDGTGKIVSEVVENPIGRLPMVNIALEKDNQYFVRRGASITDFAIEFATILSDLANTVKLQSYAQAVITSEKAPDNLKVGANNVIWLKQDPASTKDPRFEFVSPSPDINASLEYMESVLRLFLSSRSIDPKSVSGKLTGQQYSSGIERLLAMVSAFEASKDDMDLFRKAEGEIFGLLRDWSNIMQGVNDESRLMDSLNITTISDNVTMSIKYHGPEAIKSDDEKLMLVERRMDRDLMSRKGAIMQLDEVDEDRALEMIEEIDEDEMRERERMQVMNPAPPQPQQGDMSGEETGEAPDQDGDEQTEVESETEGES